MDTLTAVIDATGITAPTYDEILASLKQSFQGIYGTDIYIEPDSQDGQLLALAALAIHSANQTAIAVYQSFSPTFSQGAGLSAMVKINGLLRKSSSASTASVRLTGVVGASIKGGIVQDVNGNLWDLPTPVTIPSAGFIDVTATCRTQGSTAAPPHTITKIFTPTSGWQSVDNSTAATLGLPVESDAQLRQRQSVSTMLPSQTPAEGILSAISNLIGVVRAAIYENSTGAPDANGIPAHAIAVVVDGGVDQSIANTISLKKTLGTATAGSTTVAVVDPAGYTSSINFYHLTKKEIYVDLNVHPLAGFTSTTEAVIQAAVQTFLNSLAIGESVKLAWVQAISQLIGNQLGQTFQIMAVAIGFVEGGEAAADLAIAFNEAANVSSLVNTVITIV